MNLEFTQCELQKTGLDGWLFFDHHEHDPLAHRVLGQSDPTKQKGTNSDAKW